MWEINYYTSRRGDCEVYCFLQNLKNNKYQAAILKKLDQLEQFGPYRLLSSKIVEKVDSNLYELKCHYGKSIFRALFGILSKEKKIIFLATIFVKKQNKLTRPEIDLAKQRIKDKINNI